jgi:hypothetical protein
MLPLDEALSSSSTAYGDVQLSVSTHVDQICSIGDTSGAYGGTYVIIAPTEASAAWTQRERRFVLATYMLDV